jgi:hypothetical protein
MQSQMIKTRNMVFDSGKHALLAVLRSIPDNMVTRKYDIAIIDICISLVQATQYKKWHGHVSGSHAMQQENNGNTSYHAYYTTRMNCNASN